MKQANPQFMDDPANDLWVDSCCNSELFTIQTDVETRERYMLPIKAKLCPFCGKERRHG